jgi:hypothetical protein
MCKNYYDFIKEQERQLSLEYTNSLIKSENKKLEKQLNYNSIDMVAHALNMKRGAELEMELERRIYENEYKNESCSGNACTGTTNNGCFKGSGDEGSGLIVKFAKDIIYINKYNGSSIQFLNYQITDINHSVYIINRSKNFNNLYND